MAEKRRQKRGELRFPYHRLDTALEVARIIEAQGAGRLRRPDLARHLGLSVTSSSFEMRLVSARLFGLIHRSGDFYEATALAKRALSDSPKEQVQALLEAFRSVPLFEAALTRFDGTPLPADDAGLVTVLEGELGVKRGEGDRARRFLTASAKVAGLIQAKEGKTWLVSTPAREAASPSGMPEVGTPLAPPPLSAPPSASPVPSQLSWPPIDPKDLAEWEPEKLKVYMDGLEKIARALRGEPPATKEEDGAE